MLKVKNRRLAEKQTLEFCEFLQVKQPLPETITLQLQVPALAEMMGIPFVFGVYDHNRKAMVVSIHQQAAKPAKFLCTVAHEYRHAKQFLEGTIKLDRVVAGFLWDAEAEKDAEDFGERMVEEFFASRERKADDAELQVDWQEIAFGD